MKRFVILPLLAFALAYAGMVCAAGPHKGQIEELTEAELTGYHDEAEAKWGNYIPGSLFREPRFIPGTERKILPLIELDTWSSNYGQKIGWVDENGVHKNEFIEENGFGRMRVY